MRKPPRLKRTLERHYSAHHMFIEVARRANEVVLRSQPGWSYEAITAILFSAFAVEALANAFGERKVADWDDFESARPAAKLRVVCQALGLDYDASLEPWSTALWLFKVRNMAVHAKPKFIREEALLTQEELDIRLFDRPTSKLENEITIANAARAHHAASSIKDLLCGCIPPQEALGLIVDGSFGTTKLHDGDA